MNLIEAIKSGRPFRRGPDHGWVTMHKNGKLFWEDDGGGRPPLREEWESETWEIQEPAVTITWTQFWRAVDSARMYIGRLHGKDDAEFQGELARRLGLEPEAENKP